MSGLHGGEPKGSIDCNEKDYKIALIKALNWYSYNKNDEDARKFILEHIKKTRTKTEYENAYKSKIFLNTSVCWLTKLQANGAVLSAEHSQKIEEQITQMIMFSESSQEESETEQQEKETTPKHNIQEAIEEKAKTFIGEYLEVAMDNRFENFNLLEVMKQLNVPGPYLRWVTPWVDSKLEQYKAVQEDNEGYSLSKIELRKIVKALTSYKEDLDSYLKVKRASRKPRAIKKKSPIEIVKNLKYLKEFSELKLKSIYPQDILGASALWVYNTKTRKIGVYRANDADGLTVKGTTILNYKPNESIQKTLRKPDEVIPTLMSAGKIAQRKFLDQIKAVDTELSGRINEDIILLKVY